MLLNHAFALGSGTGAFPTATDMLSIGTAATGSLIVTTISGESVDVGGLAAGMWPIRCVAVTTNTAGHVVGWWV